MNGKKARLLRRGCKFHPAMDRRYKIKDVRSAGNGLVFYTRENNIALGERSTYLDAKKQYKRLKLNMIDTFPLP